MTSTPDEITRLLISWNQGDQRARDELTPLIYDELRRLARGYLRRERPGHTPQPTAQLWNSRRSHPNNGGR